MATFNPFNGDTQPVFNLDIHNGNQTGSITAAALAQPQGPKLDFFKLIVENGSNSAQDLRGELGSYSASVFDPGLVKDIMEAVQEKATVAMYQVEADTSGQVSLAVYPQDAWTTSTLQAAVRALGTVTITKSDGTTRTVDVSGSDVTSGGFKLA